MEVEQLIPEITWMSILKTGGFMYAILAAALSLIMVGSTYFTCGKTHFAASFMLGASITFVPTLVYVLSMKYTFIRQPFASVLQKLGLSEERASSFGSIYILILFLLPLMVYSIHSAEESACVATADEMSSFKTKMLKELQEKQEAEEKNEKKK